ncbi:acyl-CoA thioesterase [Winogradskyella undariae]|uniref:acyl-CoA thioesterase n=1 Tax=Winogradskyella undariae TaxID=1285465 RepID=UPI00156AAE86|nr:acyl-CoA thioesterase [Winogradskyella undariae]NRR92216.1 acyl-CoA thioesterase [Winogradskyella undariae]
MFKSIKESKIEISELMLPSNTNFGGKIHGGYILSLMDQIAFACASKHSRSYCVTASVDKVNFLRPIEVGELVTMKASINYVGKSSMVVGIRVEAENIRTGNIKHCNSSYFTMVAVNENGKTESVPGLVISSKIEAKRFIRAIKRREDDVKKDAYLSEIYKNVDQYLELLKDYRVKIEI